MTAPTQDLAESDQKFDYLVIESTGISEPLPVAQTFVMDVNNPDAATPAGQEAQMKKEHEGHDHDGDDQNFEPLFNYARLDTCVTG